MWYQCQIFNSNQVLFTNITSKNIGLPLVALFTTGDMTIFSKHIWAYYCLTRHIDKEQPEDVRLLKKTIGPKWAPSVKDNSNIF